MGHPYCLVGVVLTYQPCAVLAAEQCKAQLIIYYNQSAQPSRCVGKLYINCIHIYICINISYLKMKDVHAQKFF